MLNVFFENLLLLSLEAFAFGRFIKTETHLYTKKNIKISPTLFMIHDQTNMLLINHTWFIFTNVIH